MTKLDETGNPRPCPVNASSDMNVIVVDLLSNTPPYNSALVNALVSAGVTARLAATSVRFDLGYYQRNSTPLLDGLIDLIARMGIRNKLVRRILRTIEYHANLLLLTIRCFRSRPSIVHIMWLPFLEHMPFDLLFVRFLRRAGIQVVYTVHNVLPHELGRNSKRAYTAAYSLADRLICHTNSSRAALVNAFSVGEEKIEVIPHGPLAPSPGEPSGKVTSLLRSVANADARVLQFGYMRPYKGVGFLLDVWRKVAEQHSGCMLVIAGAGDPAYTSTLEAKIDELGIRQRVVTHFDYLSDADLSHLMRACDVLVYPYEEITQSGALCAGMAAGKAIVASNIGGLAETIRHGSNGLVADYGDVDGFAEALLDVIRNPGKRERLGRAAKADMDNELSWESIAQKTAALYRSLSSQ